MKISQNVIEAFKEFLRVLLIAVVPVIIVSLESPAITLKALVFSVILAALRAVEKWLHKEDSKVQIPF